MYNHRAVSADAETRSAQVANSIAKDLETSVDLQISSIPWSTENFMELVSMTKKFQPSLTSPRVMQSARCSGVKYTPTGV